MSMQKHAIMAVVAAIMMGDGDFKLKYAPAKSLFLWVLLGHNLCGGAQRGTSLALGSKTRCTVNGEHHNTIRRTERPDQPVVVL